ncbi:MAG: hypothetical protein LWY06_08355 [Firmicutes bacterium]|nr:hypothetical protein [Bacillota bacterium]
MHGELSEKDKKVLNGLPVIILQELAAGISKDAIAERIVKEFRFPEEIIREMIDVIKEENAEYLEKVSPDNPEFRIKQKLSLSHRKIGWGIGCMAAGIFLAVSIWLEGAVNSGTGILAGGSFLLGAFFLVTGIKDGMICRSNIVKISGESDNSQV